MNLTTKKLLFVLQQKYKILHAKNATFQMYLKVEMAQPAEIECSCIPINVLKSDIDEGRSPFGEDNENCFQVDSKIVYKNNSFVNSKSNKMIYSTAFKNKSFQIHKLYPF